MAPAAQKKKKVVVDTSNAKIDSYFKPAPTQKQGLLRKAYNNVNENADCNDENKALPISSQSSSQGKGGKQQTTLSLTKGKQPQLGENGGGATKRQFGGENGSNRQFGENKRLKAPSTNNSQATTHKFENGLTKSRENDITVPSLVDVKSRGAGENIGLINPKHSDTSTSSRQPLKEKEIKTLHMNKSIANRPSILTRKSAPATTSAAFQVHCDDDNENDEPLDTPLTSSTGTTNILTTTQLSTDGSRGDLRDLNTQFIPEREEEDEICNTQATHFTVITSPVDLSYQNEFENDDEDNNDNQLFVYRDDNNDGEGAALNVYKDGNSDDDTEEGSSSLFPKTEPTNIKLKPIVIEEDDALPPLFEELQPEEEEEEAPIRQHSQRQSFFLSDHENEEEEKDESNSTIDNFFNNSDDEEQAQIKKSSLEQNPFIFDADDDFSVGINDCRNSYETNSADPSLTLEPESFEAVKEYHRPYPIPRGRDLYEKFNMSKQDEEDDYLSSQQPPSQGL